jgi:DNA repair photolyase
MIISASYKTDIPAFYGEWFMNRLKAGYCKMVNPYNQQVYTIDLTPETVDGFVFWTKNIGPFLKHLSELEKRDFAFIVQHTINGYPKQLESRVINYSHTIEHMRKVAEEYGPDIAVWRYDPIIISSLTTTDWHRRNFEELARALEGTTNEAVVSFAQIYKKTRRNVNKAAEEFNFDWSEHERMSEESIKNLIIELAQIAAIHGIQLKICSQKSLLIPGVVNEARCVDADRLEKVSHRTILDKSKQKGNRKECGCFSSKDIGEYDTCPHGCVYCYAVQNRDLALSRYKEHDPLGDFLFPPKNYVPSENEKLSIIPVSKVRKKGSADLAIQENLF